MYNPENGKSRKNASINKKELRFALPFYEDVLSRLTYIKNKILFILDIHPDSSVHINEHTWFILFSNSGKNKNKVLLDYKQKLNKKLIELYKILHIFFCSNDIQKYKFAIKANILYIKNSPGHELHKRNLCHQVGNISITNFTLYDFVLLSSLCETINIEKNKDEVKVKLEFYPNTSKNNTIHYMNHFDLYNIMEKLYNILNDLRSRIRNDEEKIQSSKSSMLRSLSQPTTTTLNRKSRLIRSISGR